MNTKSIHALAYGAAIAVVLGGVYLSMYSEGRPSRPVAPSPSSQTAVAVSQPSTMPVQQAAATPTPPTPSATTVLTKAQLVDKLRKSPSPVDAFTAYNIIRACVFTRRSETEVYENQPSRPPTQTSAQACGDLAPGQIVSRLQLLDRAGRAGVHGAFYARGLEGQDGNGATGNEDPQSPAYAEWTRILLEYQAAGVKTGDQMSLLSSSDRYENERDFPKALAYWVAATELSNKSRPNVVARLSRLMTPEQAAAAIAEGKQIASAAQPIPGDKP